nr:uncharacterized protein LOC109161280 [Ipomoea batatas]
MEEDEWGFVCLKEKVSEIGLGMDEGLRYFTVNDNGLKELTQDCEVWDLVNQCKTPKVIEIWIIRGVVGADCSNDGSNDGSGEEYDVSGEEIDGSEEAYDGSGEEIGGSGEDDADFLKNTDLNVEYGGLGDVEVQNQDNDNSNATPHGVPFQEPQQVQVALQPAVQVPVHVPVHDPVHDPVHVPVQVPVHEPDVITQPEVEDNQWEILDDILDAHWHQVDLHTGGNVGGVALTTTNRIDVTPIQSCCHDHATATAQQGMTSKGKAVKAPSKDRRKKLPIRKYATRSKAFKSSFFGNEKDPIKLD